MAKNCNECKFHDTDYFFDEEIDDEVEYDVCEKGCDEVYDDDADCATFKKCRRRNPAPSYTREYVRGIPDSNGNCEIIECTTL